MGRISPSGLGGFLLNYAEFSAAVECPGLLGAGWICRHLTTEADRLDEIGIHAGINERLANGLGAALAETAIVFLCSAFISEPGNDDFPRRAFH